MRSLRFRRRTLFAAGAASLLGAGALAWRGLTPRPVWAVPPRPDLPRRLSKPRRVVVVGAGLAGLSAAIELVERGFEVELLEAASHAGGRAGGWRAAVDGAETAHEHAFHAFFHHYYSLRDLLNRAADPADFLPTRAYPVAVRDRGIHIIEGARAPFPLPLTETVRRSPLLKLADFAESGPDSLLDLLRYDPVRTFDKLDGTSFTDWARSARVPQVMLETLYDPFIRTTFVRPEEVSAAAVIQLFHAYFLANPEGLGFDLQRRAAPDSVIDPLTRHFESLGGVFRPSTPATALAFDGPNLRGVLRRVAGPAIVLATLPAADVPPTGFARADSADGPIFVARAGEGFAAFLGLCTHQQCPVTWHGTADRFECPCHGGRFAPDGAPFAGPPKAPLPAVEVRVRGEALDLWTTRGTGEELIAADDVILATDPKALRPIAAATAWPTEWRAFAQRLASVPLCRPYSVARLWLDKPVHPNRPPIFTLGGYRPLDEVFVMSQFQEGAKEWAQRNGGSVIETHCYALDPSEAGDPELLAFNALARAAEILPELAPARVRHRELQLLDNFPAAEPGSHASRLTAGTPVPRLHLAGDHLRLDLPVELMERAVVSGRIAANRILDGEGLAPVPIQTPPLTGLL